MGNGIVGGVLAVIKKMLFALLILFLLVITLNKVAFELQQFTAETPGDVLSFQLYQRQVVVAAMGTRYHIRFTDDAMQWVNGVRRETGQLLLLGSELSAQAKQFSIDWRKHLTKWYNGEQNVKGQNTGDRKQEIEGRFPIFEF